MSHPLVSVITPAYNASAYVQRAYQCLRRQDASVQWEWVVVDDGSIDDTFRQLSDIADMDSRVRVVRQQNSGMAKIPRDRAAFLSSGEFLVPLDIDDTLSDDYLITMLKRQRETNADIVYATMHMFGEGKEQILPTPDVDTWKVYQGRDLVRYTLGEWKIGCMGLYRRSVWTRLAYPDVPDNISFMSDEVTERAYLISSPRVTFSKAVYHYELHPGSVTRVFTPRHINSLHSMVELQRIILDEFGKKSPEYHAVFRENLRRWVRLARQYKHQVINSQYFPPSTSSLLFKTLIKLLRN